MNSEIFKTFHIRTRFKQFFHNMGIRVRVPKHQNFLNEKFYLYGKIIPDYDTGWSIELSRDAKIIFDIGCNIGVNAILFNKFSSMKRIYLFEPNPDALSLAVENSILNGFSKKVRIFNYCISNENNKILEFYSVLEGAAGSLYEDYSSTAKDLNNSYDVKTKTIDKICADENVIPDFVKIDVEGHEFQVLEGSKRTALNGKTKFLVEIHSSKLLPIEENLDRVINWAKSISYKVLYLAKMKFINDSESIKNRGRCHLLLVPENFSLTNRLKSIKEGETGFNFL